MLLNFWKNVKVAKQWPIQGHKIWYFYYCLGLNLLFNLAIYPVWYWYWWSRYGWLAFPWVKKIWGFKNLQIIYDNYHTENGNESWFRFVILHTLSPRVAIASMKCQFLAPNWIYLRDSVLSLIDPTIAGTGSVARDARVDYFTIWN